MFNHTILSTGAIFYVICSIIYLCNLFFKAKKIAKTATLLTLFAFLAHTTGFLIRWIETYQMGLGHFHIFTLYELLTFTAWAIIIIYLIAEIKVKNKAIGGFVVPIAAIIMMYATLSLDSAISPLPEVLQGNFYNYHAITGCLSYAPFTLSFGASIIFLFKRKEKVGSLSPKGLMRLFPSITVLDNIIYQAIAFGFIFFTIQMITGLFRTKIIWGSYWEWDPALILSLLTWLIYATILHGRYMRWWGKHMTAILSIIGFISAIITFLILMGYVFTTGHYLVS